MNNEKKIDALNSLIEINNDRISGYETATKEAKEADLKMLFSQHQNTSIKNKTELTHIFPHTQTFSYSSRCS